jgi:dTMP kinase
VAQLIAVEGIDGSGKGTQAARLVAELTARGHSCRLWSFPRYRATQFGAQIGAFLNGKFGSLHDVHPVLVSLLFAGDRLETRTSLLESLADADFVICDRYVPSNIAHQGAKVAGAERAELVRWVEYVEYDLFALPRPDVVLWLDMPVVQAQELITRKAQRDYTDRAADLQEADADYLARVRAVYAELAHDPRWITIAAMGTSGLRSPEEITTELVERVLRPESGRPT